MSQDTTTSSVADTTLPDLEQHDRLIEQTYEAYTQTIRQHAAGEVDGRKLKAAQEKLRKAREDREYAGVLYDQIVQARQERDAYQQDMQRADQMQRASKSAQQVADLAQGITEKIVQIQDELEKLNRAVDDARRTYPKRPDQHTLLGGPKLSMEANDASNELQSVASRFEGIMAQARDGAVTADADAKSILKRHGERVNRPAASKAKGKAQDQSQSNAQDSAQNAQGDTQSAQGDTQSAPEEAVIDDETL